MAPSPDTASPPTASPPTASPDTASPPTASPPTAPPGRPPADTHEWVSFEDDEEERLWVLDVTFLTSRWTCIFGRGCQGVLTGPAPELVQGCCSYGAHFTDDADVARVEEAAAELAGDEWQFAGRGRKAGRVDVVKKDRSGATVTRMVDGACIFLNRPGFPAGAGCALHQAAARRGRLPLELKPDVCWQLPLRREEAVDSTGRVVTTITEWDRRHWGAGGSEFHWWCTEAPEAFTGARPVWKEMGPELIALVGPAVYLKLAAYLERGTEVRLPHPTVRGSRNAPAPLSSL